VDSSTRNLRRAFSGPAGLGFVGPGPAFRGPHTKSPTLQARPGSDRLLHESDSVTDNIKIKNGWALAKSPSGKITGACNWDLGSTSGFVDHWERSLRSTTGFAAKTFPKTAAVIVMSAIWNWSTKIAHWTRNLSRVEILQQWHLRMATYFELSCD